MGRSKQSKSVALHHVGMCRPIEMALVGQVIRGTDVDYVTLDKCCQQGFLPSKLMEHFVAMKFVTRTVVAAKKAQRTYGVPASVLMAIGIYETAWEAADLIDDPETAVEWPACECCYSPETLGWFMKMAALLAESPKYKGAMALLPDLEAYLTRLGSLGFNCPSDRDGGEVFVQDLLQYIRGNDLDECDQPEAWTTGVRPRRRAA